MLVNEVVVEVPICVKAVLVAPVGGEPGQVLRGLIRSSGIDFSPVAVAGDSSAYVHDRRGGERTEVAASRAPDLDRHEIDDLYARVLQHSIQAGVCVVTGLRPEDRLPVEFYTRLSKDCAAAEVRTVGDLHGSELHAFLDGGSLDLLKVSDEDLAQDGLISDLADSDEAVIEAVMGSPLRRAATVVVSRGKAGALALSRGRHLRAVPPTFEVVDAAGSGDSMTAALVVQLVRGADVEAALDDTRVPLDRAGAVIGVAGSVTTTAAMVLDLATYDRALLDGAVVGCAAVQGAAGRLAAMTVEERKALGFMHPGRADVIVAGALILDRVLRRTPVESLLVSESDILDGIAWSLVG